MLLEPGFKLFVAHRRLFESDHDRYFVGVVESYEAGFARAAGYTWIRDGYDGVYKRKVDERTKIVSLSSGNVMVYQLSSQIDIDSLVIRTENANVFLRDSSGFQMDITEGVLRGGSDPPRGHVRYGKMTA